MSALTDAQQRALAARLTAAEGEPLLLAAYAQLAGERSSAAAGPATDVTTAVAQFSAICDALFATYDLPRQLRDRRLVPAEQVGRVEAALEDLTLPPTAGREATAALADLRMAVAALARAVENLRPDLSPAGEHAVARRRA